MKVNQRNFRAFWAALPLVLFISIWLSFAPEQVGGNVVYVILNGTSMEPQFKYGDLVLLRNSSGYKVGDAVAYKNTELGRFVFHRIIREENDQLILKGDNNDWEDDYAPVEGELLGKLWVHIPHVGKAVHWLRQPIILAMTSAIFLISILMGWVMSIKNKLTLNVESFSWAKSLQTVSYLFGIITFSSLLVFIFSLTKPSLVSSVVNLPIYHYGSFNYSGSANQDIYDSTTFSEPSPIFPALTCLTNFGFGYSFNAEQTSDIAGSYKINAEILEPQSGWKRILSLIPETPFSGNVFAASAGLDLCKIQGIIKKFEEVSGFHSSSYFLSVSPEIKILGKINGKSFTDTYSSSLDFKFDGVMFSIKQNAEVINPLVQTSTGTIIYPKIERTAIRFLGISLRVDRLRSISFMVFLFGVFGYLLLSLYLNKLCREKPEMVMKLKYGSILLDVNRSDIEPSQNIINVSSIDELAKIAESRNKLIFFRNLNLSTLYFVESDGINFRFIQVNQNVSPKSQKINFLRLLMRKDTNTK